MRCGWYGSARDFSSDLSSFRHSAATAFVQMLHLAGSDDGGRDARLDQHPGQGYLRVWDARCVAISESRFTTANHWADSRVFCA